MRKQEFLDVLKTSLNGLPKQEMEDRLNFYSEIIDDRMEEGYTEEEAVSEIGSVNQITEQIIADTPLIKVAKERIRPKKRLQAWEIVLLIIGSPLWLSLLLTAFIVILTIYISLWSVVISLWSVFGALVGCSFGGAVVGTAFICMGNGISGFALIGIALVLTGISIFFFFGCKATTKGFVLLTKKIAVGTKKCFLKKENA